MVFSSLEERQIDMSICLSSKLEKSCRQTDKEKEIGRKDTGEVRGSYVDMSQREARDGDCEREGERSIECEK